MERLLLSSMTCVNCLGAGPQAMVDAFRSDTGGLAPCRFDAAGELSTYVGEVTGLEAVQLRPDLAQYDCRNNRIAQLALEQPEFLNAVEAACETYGRSRIGVFAGTSTSGMFACELAYRNRNPDGALPKDFRFATTHDISSLTDFVQKYLRLEGPALTVSTACASTGKVFGSAARMIESGVCDAAIVGGADSLCLTTLFGFNSLELVSSAPCRPFDSDRDGISIGEAAGFVLLERLRRPVGSNDVTLLGIGESSDAHHMSHPHPQGFGARIAMERALAAARLPASAVDYVNLHGTATKSGDSSEDIAVCAIFGSDTPCSSTKGFLGHTLGAAGITEAIISAMSIRHGFMPGSHNTSRVDPTIKCRYLRHTQSASVRVAMSNSFGFGGSNCSLIFSATM